MQKIAHLLIKVNQYRQLARKENQVRGFGKSMLNLKYSGKWNLFLRTTAL